MTTEYPSDWNKRRELVYERDSYTCQNCGERGGQFGPAELHAHHGVPKSKGGTHQLSNLTTYCSDCHKAIHGKGRAPERGIYEQSAVTESSFEDWFEFIEKIGEKSKDEGNILNELKDSALQVLRLGVDLVESDYNKQVSPTMTQTNTYIESRNLFDEILLVAESRVSEYVSIPTNYYFEDTAQQNRDFCRAKVDFIRNTEFSVEKMDSAFVIDSDSRIMRVKNSSDVYRGLIEGISDGDSLYIGDISDTIDKVERLAIKLSDSIHKHIQNR